MCKVYIYKITGGKKDHKPLKILSLNIQSNNITER